VGGVQQTVEFQRVVGPLVPARWPAGHAGHKVGGAALRPTCLHGGCSPRLAPAQHRLNGSWGPPPGCARATRVHGGCNPPGARTTRAQRAVGTGSRGQGDRPPAAHAPRSRRRCLHRAALLLQLLVRGARPVDVGCVVQAHHALVQLVAPEQEVALQLALGQHQLGGLAPVRGLRAGGCGAGGAELRGGGAQLMHGWHSGGLPGRPHRCTAATTMRCAHPAYVVCSPVHPTCAPPA